MFEKAIFSCWKMHSVQFNKCSLIKKNSVILYKIENKSAGIRTMLLILMIRVSVLTQQALLSWEYQYFVEHLPTTTIPINLWDVLKFDLFIPRMALPWAVDSFAVYLHSTNGRHCKRTVIGLQNHGNSYLSRMPIMHHMGGGGGGGGSHLYLD